MLQGVCVGLGLGLVFSEMYAQPQDYQVPCHFVSVVILRRKMDPGVQCKLSCIFFAGES